MIMCVVTVCTPGTKYKNCHVLYGSVYWMKMWLVLKHSCCKSSRNLYLLESSISFISDAGDGMRIKVLDGVQEKDDSVCKTCSKVSHGS